jgi:hypothetical protein
MPQLWNFVALVLDSAEITAKSLSARRYAVTAGAVVSARSLDGSLLMTRVVPRVEQAGWGEARPGVPGPACAPFVVLATAGAFSGG